MTKKQRRQQGFTLIEIIAVIILLGVLAATIIPKFNDLTADAKNAAAKQAVAEGIARVNSEAAKYILKNSGTLPSATADLTGITSGEDAGDYTIAYSAVDSATGGITITASGEAGSAAEGSSATGLAYLPTT